MILQSIVYPNDTCSVIELFYRGNNKIIQRDDSYVIPCNSSISFYTYMNMFDMDVWNKYTDISYVCFRIYVKGIGKLILKSRINKKEKFIGEQVFNSGKFIELTFKIDAQTGNGQCYFEIESEQEVIIKDGCFETESTSCKSVNITLNMCTYQRKDWLCSNLKKIRTSRFFDISDELYNKLNVIVD